MSDDKVTSFPRRGSLADAGFQASLRAWRKFAHRRGLVVASPVRLIGAERTFMGDSDDEGFGPKDYRLAKEGGLAISLGGLYLSKEDKAFLEGIFEELDDRSDFDIKDVRAPSDAQVEKHENEKGRWDIWLTDKQRIGTVVRIGDGSQKHYLLYLWSGGWYKVVGQPCYDLPLFGLPDLRARPEAPVMIHEGPKSWRGAVRSCDQRTMAPAKLRNWMNLYCHVAWHGSDIGMEWTDWSVLRGRRVLIWPDIDEAGLSNARALARRIAFMGGIVEYVNWGRGDIEAYEGWDWGDPMTGSLENLTRTEVRQRIQRVESPVGADGRLLEEWCKRSFYDPERKEIYVQSRDYRPLPLDSMALGLPKNFRTALVASSINPFVGVDFRPGLPQGRMWNGKINLCPPHPREPVYGAPLPKRTYQELCLRWLRNMIPNPIQRKHLIRRAAWAVARPHKVPQHMIVMQGESGIGKSVFLDLIVRVIGEDRAASLFPDSILTRFNAAAANKSVICIHEIHSDEMTRKQNAARLKELIANEVIITEEKNRPRVSHANVVHWFAATNERVPFSLEHGNDRFYFIKCVSPLTNRERRRMEKFFREWVPRFQDPVFLDELYAAAKYQVTTFNQKTVNLMTGRARRQSVWRYLEQSSLRPWEQFLLNRLEELMDPEYEFSGEAPEHPPVFLGSEVVRLTARQYSRIGEDDIRRKMNEFGYRALTRDDEGGGKIQQRIGPNRREVVWCREKDINELRAYWLANGKVAFGVRSLYRGD